MPSVATTATATVGWWRLGKWSRRLLWSTTAVTAAGAALEVATDHSPSRSARALYNFAKIAAMYKYNKPQTQEEYFAMHQRAADAILYVCLTNEGLYVKLGQGLNSMSHILPKQYTDTLKVLLDNAKPVDMVQIRAIIEEETGMAMEDVFDGFEERPVASASIAQVHKAWLKNPREWSRRNKQHNNNGNHNANVDVDGDDDDGSNAPVAVAIKVRKPCIGKQSKWDIYTFQFISYAVQQAFSLPTQWSRKTICDGLLREMDFRIEAANAEQFRRDFANDPRVYVPVVFHRVSSERLMVMEWVDAAKLSEVEKVQANFNAPAVLRKLFDAFGDMVFKYGFVHCDPHAANILVRHMPDNEADARRRSRGLGNSNDKNEMKRKNQHASSGDGESAKERLNSRLSRTHSSNSDDKGGETDNNKTKKTTATHKKGDKNDFQIVLLDFGLCVPETERFRMQYALLFKSLATRDMAALRGVVMDWGISDPDTFASMQMQKPLKSIQSSNYDEVTKEEVRQMQRDAHARLKHFMIDEAKIPRELPMVGRGVDILRGVNRLYGSPINRVNMFVSSAVEALGPLHDYAGVQRYLERVEALVGQMESDDGKSNAGGVMTATLVATTTTASGTRTRTTAEADAQYSSVYDEGALALRRVQAAAMRELAAERDQSLRARTSSRLESVYRMFIFHSIMFSFSLVHYVTQWCNAILALALPAEAGPGDRLHAQTLEERLETMESSARVE